MNIFEFDSLYTLDNWTISGPGLAAGASGAITILAGTGAVFAGEVVRTALDSGATRDRWIAHDWIAARSPALNLDLRAEHGLRLQVRGDGRRYGCELHATGWPGLRHLARFDTKPNRDSWATISIPFGAFRAYWAGRRLRWRWMAPGPALGRVDGISFIVDGSRAGAFRLEVARVATYRIESILGFPGS